ncbi:MAG: hypothetical protein KGJ01_03730 [Patescibacteria group bacterium]|nr:hypothetical protein [Patescibacteria group bacterium]
MNVSDLGKKRGSTPAYGVFSKEKKDIQREATFLKKGKKFKDSQDLMGGPKKMSIENMSPSDRANFAKQKLEEVSMRSFGRYHQ